MSRILVTGGSGFIGSHLISELKRRGNEVWNYDIVDGQDILDFDDLEGTFNEVDPEEVYHLAGSVTLNRGEADPFGDLKLNGLGTLNVIDLCKKHSSKLMFTGTGATYGIGPVPHVESLPPMSVCNYGISKYAAECYILKETWVNKLKGLIVRFSSVFGPGRGRGPVNIFARQAKEQGFMTVHGPGHHTRDVLNIRDCIRAMILVMDRGEFGQVYNIGSGKATSVIEIAWIIHELTGAEVKHVTYEHSLYDLPKSWFDISKIRALGFEPEVTLQGGIKELLEDE